MDPRLPISQRRNEIEAAIRANPVVVVCGETGSGKTTQLPQICLAMGRGSGGGTGIIGHTQPRRLAARAVAARIAEELQTPLGGLVGVKVRFQDTTSRDTRIKLLTDGMLLAELASDPALRAYDTIIIDEAHERSLNIDFLLGILRGLVDKRPELRVVITSATIDPKRLASFFETKPGTPVPIIEVSGRTFPVSVRYQPPAAADDWEEYGRIDPGPVVDAVEQLLSPRLPEGDVLVFLPGEREIRMTADALRRAGTDAEILPLFARLSSQDQDRIFHPSGGRRVVLATNIAETSLTVPGIRYVVDAGLARLNRYDPQRKVQRLPIEPVSRASAIQRSGRCGRVAEGVAIRLYSEKSFNARPLFTDPEILRSSLAGVILQMKALGLGDIERFPFLDPPAPAAIKDGYETLFELGAIDKAATAGKLTDIGRAIARLPVDPRIGRMLLAAEREGAVDEVLVLAAALSIQDPRERPQGKQEDADRAQLVFRDESSDFVTLLKLWEQYEHAADQLAHSGLRDWCSQRFVSMVRMREWGDTVRQLRVMTDELGLRRGPRDAAPATPDRVHRAMLTGLISNVACREGAAGTHEYRGARGNQVSLFPGSVLFRKSPKWIMAAELVHTTRLFARNVAEIDPAWIEELAGHMFQHTLSDRHFDTASGEPSAWERVTMSGIVVVPRRRAPIARLDPAGARELFVREGLAVARWETPLPFMARNRAVLARAAEAEARLRRRGVAAPIESVAEWFDKRLPREVLDGATLTAWWNSPRGGASNPSLLDLPAGVALGPDAGRAFDGAMFPGTLKIDSGTGGDDEKSGEFSYALAPGQEHDGVTLTVALTSLPFLTLDRVGWLVPGYLPDVIAALIKSLPKAHRAPVEAKGDVGETARHLAELVTFGHGALPDALTEALEVLHDLRVPASAWSGVSLPTHLTLRIRVVDHHGVELGAGRDLAALLERFGGRIARARAAEARARFDQPVLTDWSFGDLPHEVASEQTGGSGRMYPAVIDRGEHVSLTLVESAEESARESHAGVRRLLALACREEVRALLDTLPRWGEMEKWYHQLGTAEQFADQMTCLVAERAFMAGHAPPRTRAGFDAMKDEGWARLVTVSREVGDVVARILEPRSKVAHRLSGGTPRLWAASIADIREHAAYLMPRGFLLLAGWERLRHYPRYAEGMRARLFRLREDGSGAETELLAKFGVHWKRFTGWVAGAMSAERAAAQDADAQVEHDRPRQAPGGKPGKAPLPQARRAAPRVNLEAGEWSMQPGNLPSGVLAYRWALEEVRVGLFAPELTPRASAAIQELEGLWSRAGTQSK